MITTLPQPCWELRCPDGSVFDGGNDGAPHFDTEDDAAQEADERASAWPEVYTVGELTPRRLAAPCYTVACNECKRSTESDSFLLMHYPGVAEAVAEAREFDFFVDGQGNAWCDDCKVLTPHDHVADPDGGEGCVRCGVDVQDHDSVQVAA